MVAWFLTVLLVPLLAVPVSAAPGRPLCLVCHPVHYAERGSCSVCHRGNPASARKNVAHNRLIAGRYARFTLADGQELQGGNRLLDQYACRRCHVIGSRGNHLSVNLDQAAIRRSPAELAAAIQQPVQNMPDFRMKTEQATALVNVLLSAASQQTAVTAVRTQLVHFDQSGTTGPDLFSIKCGPCHRVLSQRLGGVGRGNAGPNLSGLLSPFYPKSYKDSESWNAERLRNWLDNPRAVRSGARMQPIKLNAEEFRDLLKVIEVGDFNN